MFPIYSPKSHLNYIGSVYHLYTFTSNVVKNVFRYWYFFYFIP